jgi:hypothetical protein
VRPVLRRPNRLPLLASLFLLIACAHAPRADDADLAGVWEGTATPQGRAEAEPFTLRLDLVVTRGQVTGTGEMIPPGAEPGFGRALQVQGEFQGSRAILRVDPEGLRPHVLRVRLTEPGRLEGTLAPDLPGGTRPIAGAGSPVRIVLERGGG